MQTLQDFRKIIEKNDGVSFHDRLMAEYNGPNQAFKAYGPALDEGKIRADLFLKQARNYNDPGYAEANKKYRDVFGSDEVRLRAFYQEDSIRRAGAKQLEFKDTAYEARILGQYKDENGQISTYVQHSTDDAWTHMKFSDTMKAKWKAVGYSGDAQYVSDFWKDHSLSTGRYPKQ